MLLVFTVIPIIGLFMVYILNGGEGPIGAFELRESSSKDPRAYKILETLGSILSVKQAPDFGVSMRLGVFLIVASIGVSKWMFFS